MGSYDQINRIKEKYEKLLSEANGKINELNAKLDEANLKVDEYRKKLYDAGQGKGEVNKIKGELNKAIRDKKTVENKLKEVDGSKMINQFSPERRELINRINNLHFENKIYDSFAVKFKNGLKDVIELAYRIKNNYVNDMDYYTFVFRDNIVSLFEKMLHLTTGKKKENSATRFLQKIVSGSYSFDKEYTKEIPELKDTNILSNIMNLLNLQTTAYHGSNSTNKTTLYTNETTEQVKSGKFLLLKSDEQLLAIFTLLKFMYYFFTCKEWEMNLITLSACWFKTID